MKKGNLTGIEITDTHVKVFQARSARNHCIPYALDIRPLNDAGDAGIKTVLAECVKGRDIEDEGLMVIIPRRSVILKQMTFPSDSEHEIRKMIALQLSSQVPYGRDEVVYNFSIIEKNKDGYTAAAVAFIQKTLIHRYLKIFNSLKLYPHIVFLTSFGIANWYLSTNEKGGNENVPETTALIDIDYSQTEVCFCSKNKCLFSRNIKYGSHFLKEGDVGPFVDQLGLTFGAFKKDNMGPEIQQIAVIQTQVNDALVRKLQEYYRVPVITLNPFDSLVKMRNFQMHRLEKFSGVSVTSGLGYFSGQFDRQVNFMPKEVLITKRSKQLRLQFIKVMALLGLALVLIVGAGGIDNYHQYQYLNKLERQLSVSDKSVKEAEQKIKSLNFVRQKVQYSAFLVDVLQNLFKIAPEDITFQIVSYQAGGNFEMQGTALNPNSVNLFQGRLLESNLFKEVNLQFATQRKRFTQEYTDFKIICKLNFEESL